MGLLTNDQVTRAEIIRTVSNKTGISQTDTQITLEAILETIQQALAANERIDFRGFGSFKNKKRARKLARNIVKNTAVIVEERYVPSFSPAKAFVENIKASLAS